jgi:putative membrane-bound dehydrogenase-like protein
MSIKKNILFLICISVMFHVGCREKSTPSNETTTSSGIDIPLDRKTQSQRTKAKSPEEELAGFKLPEGFIIELVASEKDGIINPIDLTFDDAGRLWTQTARMYPLDPVADIEWQNLLKLMGDPEAQKQDPNFNRILDLYEGKSEGDDKILILSNLFNNNIPVDVKTWADGLAIPQSILPYKNGSYVAQGSELFFLSDTNNDGKADKRTRLFTGFGITDTHTMAHQLKRAPGGWIHFSHGALNRGEVSSLVSEAKIRLDYSKIARFSLDAKKIELVSSGLNNIWGFNLRGNGQWFGSEANDLGYSVVPMESGTGFPGIGNERIRSYQPWMPELHSFRVGGTGISGLAFADDDDGSFPEEWRDVALLANPISSKINAVRIIRNPDGSVSAEHLPDLLSSEDDWFRPVNMEFGPDGSLYIADWYNKIVSHNEVGTTHPDRDKSHGRIWRIRHESQKPRDITNFYEVKTGELVNYLKSPSLWAKRAAWHQISDRPLEETQKLANDLQNLAGDSSQNEVTRILALWSLEGLGHYDKELMATLLSSPEDNLRREAVRSLASFSLDVEEIAGALDELSEDGNVMVRAQVLRTLDDINIANHETIELLVKACKPELEGNAMGGAYQRNFERFLARKALESYPKELLEFLSSPSVDRYNTSSLIWASQALPRQSRERVFLDLWRKANYTELDQPTFIIVAQMLDNTSILNAVKPVLQNIDKAQTHISLALKNLAQVQSENLTKLLEIPVRHLLTSKKESAQDIGLEAVGKFGIKNVNDEVVSLLENNSKEERMDLIIKALAHQPNENEAVFIDISQNMDLSFTLRTAALHNLAKANQTIANEILSDWIPELDNEKQKLITKDLSGTKEGSILLKRLFENEVLTHKAFEISSAEKVYETDKQDRQGIILLDQVKVRLEEEKKGFDARLEKLMAIVDKSKGNADNGEKLFQVCLLCHKVGSKGKDFAPALDGSAFRENEALLTAILDPSAAMEGGYAVYRVSKKDGGDVQGYLVKKDDRGTTIGFMGGSTVFIASGEILSEEFIGGRSFMPKGLMDQYSDAEVADLFAFIKTLN